MDDTIFNDAKLGNAYAGLGVAYMYQYGKDVDPDPALALDWYMRSAEEGCSRAKWELAKIFRDGSIADQSDEYFLYYLSKAAEAGVPEARLEYALVQMEGSLVPKNDLKAFNWMHAAAEQRLPMAQFLIGYMFGQGIGTKVDKVEEEIWYSKVGVNGNAELFYWIGRNYEFGLYGVKVDLFEAGRWYKIGADMGHEKCLICWQSVLASLDGAKHDTLRDRENRLSQTDVQVEQTLRDSALTLADHCLDVEDYEGAFKNYQRAADLGNPVAQFTLALMYHDGIYVKRNDRMALDLMSRASLAGSEDAQFMMGTLYERGKGMKKDIEEAIKYYTMAAANGYLVAYYRLGLYMEHPEIHVRNSGNTIIR
ncbi:MAG: SEL1-like repeat protein [Candidatus Methanomethylophilaceae archaeon]|nr:SEL1-like repeat protein [Candidatus Methanomethylophilaceae archaeon]MDD3379044.1 SEL1-like repeat protein [Candidatus Methanomethylophilaceae archaeon]MDY0224688.1 SEL1-like repeat protein [Candidatus Methanomethylophilaceae archaeon]